MALKQIYSEMIFLVKKKKKYCLFNGQEGGKGTLSPHEWSKRRPLESRGLL